jgi:hypothetical protein
VTDLESIVANRSNRHAPEMIDRVADRLAHLADLAIASLADTNDRGRPDAHQLNVCRPCSLALDHHAVAETLHVVFVGHTATCS